MKKIIGILLLCFGFSTNIYAATWVKLNENNTSKLFLDKQSVMKKDQFQRAWVKIEYKTIQKNLESVEKEYNLSKVLWFFDCPAQKSATSQVFQYLNDELIYSVAIDYKSAEFIEPVPETDVDVAMRYVCQNSKVTNSGAADKSAKTALDSKAIKTADGDKKTEAKDKDKAGALPVKATEKTVEKPAEKPSPVGKTTKNKQAEKPVTGKEEAKHEGKHWTYEGKEGPENWGKLSADYATCDTGRNQSPINIDSVLHASLSPLKISQKFPAKDIVNNGHTVQVDFTKGNILVLDNALYQMKQVNFHAPSENKVNGVGYPLEAHFIHADSKGNLAIIAVMFKEGAENPALATFWVQMPHESGEPVAFKGRVTPSELMPTNHSYYRFSGSLTTPPCSEGVRWIVMKIPMTASKSQIEAFASVVHQHNNRPVQPLNGRVVVE